MTQTKTAFNQTNGLYASVLDPMTQAEQDDVTAGLATVNVTAALETTFASNSHIYFPPGNYLVEPTTQWTDTETSTAVRSAIRVRPGQTIVLSAGTTITAINTDESGGCFGVFSADDVCIIGNGAKIVGNWDGTAMAGRSTSTQHGIRVENSKKFYAENMDLTNWWGDGYTVGYIGDVAGAENSEDVHISNVNCTDNHRNHGSFVGCKRGSVIGGTYSGALGRDPYAGIDLEPNYSAGWTHIDPPVVQDITIQGVTCTDTPYGITGQAATAASNNLERIVIQGCTLDGGIYFNNAVHVTVSNNVVQSKVDDPDTGNRIDGIRLLNTMSSTVSGNVVYNVNGHGIVSEGTSEHNIVTGNTVYDVSQDADANYSGIFLWCSNCVAVANNVRQGGASFQAEYGLRVLGDSNVTALNQIRSSGKTGDFNQSGSTNQSLLNFSTTTPDQMLNVDTLGSQILGTLAALSTAATDGFTYLPTCAGIPSGTPTTKTGKVALVFDTVNDDLYLYNGSWKKTTSFT